MWQKSNVLPLVRMLFNRISVLPTHITVKHMMLMLMLKLIMLKLMASCLKEH